MNPFRLITAAALLAGVVAPLAGAVVLVVRAPGGLAALGEAGRWAVLAANSLGLAAGAVAVAVPAGVAGAVVLERGRVPAAGLLRGVVAVGLFVPLPVYAAGWQAAAGGGGWLSVPGAAPDSVAWKPWRDGLLPAIGVHAAAALPWVVWAVSVALRTADSGLEDDARLLGGNAAVFRLVLWPRVTAAAALASGWVAAVAFVETTVTDVMLVRSFAEEAYFQAAAGGDGVAAAVASGIPLWAASAAVAAWAVRRGAGVPAFGEAAPGRRLWAGWVAVACGGLAWAGAAVLVAAPVAGLVRTAGRHGTAGEWSARLFAERMKSNAGLYGLSLADSVLWAGVAGALAAGLALAACRAVPGRGLFVLAAVVAVTPAPVAGLGLKELISLLVAAEDAVLKAAGVAPEFPPVASLLYDQPSPLPAVWANVLRFFPVAVVLVWPAVRLIPRELLDAAALDGATWRRAVWPHTRGAAARAAAVVAALALGEVVAGKLVQPPGRQSFVQQLFNQMHYGADATVAAMCLLQLAVTAAACGAWCVVAGWAERSKIREVARSSPGGRC